MKLFLSSFIFFSVAIFSLHHFISGVEIETDPNYSAHIHIEDDEQIIREVAEAQEETESSFASAKEKNIGEKIIDSLQKDEEIDKQRIVFLYKPKEYKKDAELIYKTPIMKILDSPVFLEKIQTMVIILYDKKNYVRGNMKNKVLRLYDPKRMGKEETIAVFLHELAHYIDLYDLKKNGSYDPSHEFYTISWETTKVGKAGMTEKDFVSGYAATNAYEDFAETFLFYVLHNDDFFKKTQESEILKKKYDFFSKNLFYDESFLGTDFSQNNLKNYYRDITKIDFSLEKFLEYLKKSV